MRHRVNRWLEALGEHIVRHGWVDPTGAASPPPHLDREAQETLVHEDEPVLEATA